MFVSIPDVVAGGRSSLDRAYCKRRPSIRESTLPETHSHIFPTFFQPALSPSGLQTITMAFREDRGREAFWILKSLGAFDQCYIQYIVTDMIDE